jgi:hypothetical protein
VSELVCSWKAAEIVSEFLCLVEVSRCCEGNKEEIAFTRNRGTYCIPDQGEAALDHEAL